MILTRSRIATRAPIRRICHSALSTSSRSTPAFAFDIDGVLKQGDHVLPEAKEALQILRGNNRFKKSYPFILVTNGGGSTEAERSIKLTQELGVTITPSILIQSHTPYRALASKYANTPVLILGDKRDSDNCRLVAESYGFTHAYIPDDLLSHNPSIYPFCTVSPSALHVRRGIDFSRINFEAIFCLSDSRDLGRDIQIVVDLLLAEKGRVGTRRREKKEGENWGEEDQLPLFFSNPDLLWGNGYHAPRYGAGMFQEALSAVYTKHTGRELYRTVGGKPSSLTYDYASRLLQSLIGQDKRLGKVYMIGDNPESDIAGANAFGWESCLVRTGVFSGTIEENDPTHPATVVVDNVLDAVKFALEAEGENII